jgi:class 3 adenylate cyclase
VDFVAVVDQAIALLRQRGHLTYRTLQRQFQLDDAALDDLKDELIYGQRLAVDEEGKVLVWSGATGTTAPAGAAPAGTPAPAPLAYTPPYLAEKILTSRRTLEGERKQVTVLFADLKGSTELIRDLDPEAAQRLLDPALQCMMDAVHRYEGTVNQVMGDGIMALFGAPVAHEDHAVRACYAALAMQAALRRYAKEVRRAHGLEMQVRVGLNSGEVVVRAIGNDLHMDYSAVGQTTHLAARMEQLATPGSIRLTAATFRLAEGLVQVKALGPVPVRGLTEPVEVCELVGASTLRRRLQVAAARGLTRFVGRQPELAALQQALERTGTGHGEVVALVGEAGVGKSRLVYECVHAHHTHGWLVLESASVSYGKATPYLPVIDLLKRYTHVEDQDDIRTIRAKVTGQVLTLDETLHGALPALLSLLDALPEDSPFLAHDPPQRRRQILEALKRVFVRESQVQPLLLVFEDLHWIDTETQALLNSLVESLPTSRLLLLVNYRPEYQHSCQVLAQNTHPYTPMEEGQAAQARAEAAMTLATEQRFAQIAACGTIARGWALAEQGKRAEGMRQMREGQAALRAMGAEAMQSWVLALLAEAHETGGQAEEGLALLAEAFAVVDKNDEHFYEAELYRLQGELTLHQCNGQGATCKVANPRALIPHSQACVLDTFFRLGWLGPHKRLWPHNTIHFGEVH